MEEGEIENTINFEFFSFLCLYLHFKKVRTRFTFRQINPWFHEIQFNFKLNLKVSAFYLEKQKSFIPEKKI